MKVLDATCGEGTPVLITGPAGVGKSALAVHWGHHAADRFPGGQLYADLRGFSDGPPASPARIIRRFLGALGMHPARSPRNPRMPRRCTGRWCPNAGC